MSGTTTSPSLAGYDFLGTYSTQTEIYSPGARHLGTSTITFTGATVAVGGTVTWNNNSVHNTATYEGYYLNGSTQDPLILQGGNYYLLGDAQGLTSYTIVAAAYTQCYARGTHIATPRGDIAIEALGIGDQVLSASGEFRDIKWIGRRSYVAPFIGNNPNILPIRIRAGALGDGLPCRDLLVSPDHGMFIDGVLVLARCLINGTGITQESGLDRLEYFHIELETHDVLLAEGAPSESLLIDGNRSLFENAASFDALYPGHIETGQPCAQRVTQGALLEQIRSRLARLTPNRMCA